VQDLPDLPHQPLDGRQGLQGAQVAPVCCLPAPQQLGQALAGQVGVLGKQAD
jgi:hypothetical protein